MLPGGVVRSRPRRSPTTPCAPRSSAWRRRWPRRAACRSAPRCRCAPASREAMRADVAAALGANVASSNIAVEEQILKRLGLIPDDGGLHPAARRARRLRRPCRIYDPGTQRLLVPDCVPLDGQRVAARARDRARDGRPALRPAPLRQARPRAAAARRRRAAGAAGAGRGDATVAALELSRSARQLPGSDGADRRWPTGCAPPIPSRGVPPWLAELARFSHVDGFSFVARRARAQPVERRRRALAGIRPRRPNRCCTPRSTTPARSRCAVDDGAAAAALPGFDRRAGSDVLGELVARAWLSPSLPAEVAARAAAGWAGDRAAIYDAPPAAARADAGTAALAPSRRCAWLTIWDDAAEADDFARAAAQVPGAGDRHRAGARRSRCSSARASWRPPRSTPRSTRGGCPYPDKRGPAKGPLPSRDGLRRAKPGYARRAERCSPTTRSSARLSTS